MRKPANLCGQCGEADLEPVEWLGRPWIYRGVSLIVKESLVLMTCPRCKAVRASSETVRKLSAMFSERYAEAIRCERRRCCDTLYSEVAHAAGCASVGQACPGCGRPRGDTTGRTRCYLC